MGQTQDLISFYQNLLIKQYNGLPKASQTIQALIEPVLMPQGGEVVTDNEGNPVLDNEGNIIFDNVTEPIISLAVAQAFNIQTAVGVQLDILAKYVGVSRQGYDFSGPVTLDDTQLQQLIQIAAARNILKATTYAINFFITEFFTGTMQVFDDLNMQMTYYYSQPFGSNVVAEFFIKAGLLPKPLAVGMKTVFFGYDYFGFLEDPGADTFGDVNDSSVGGFMPMLI